MPDTGPGGGNDPATEPASLKRLKRRYDLLERIGFGGMGAVYAAYDRVMDRRVAVKELRDEYSRDEMVRKRFIREAQAAGGLSHPHIVTVHDLIEEGPTLFIVMEYLDGGTLLDRMNTAPGRRVDPDLAVEVAEGALQGLDAAHDEGLVHRDVKPGNLLFDHRGRVKIADFGVVTARAYDAAVTALTQLGTHPGTLVYMSPEQIDGAEVDGRSDVYSMGAVLYEALAGARYFERPGLRTERALMDAICELPPVPLRERVPQVSEQVEVLVHLALHKNVDMRPRAAELAEALAVARRAPRGLPRAPGIDLGPLAARPRPRVEPSDLAPTRPVDRSFDDDETEETRPRLPSGPAITRPTISPPSGRLPRIEPPTPRRQEARIEPPTSRRQVRIDPPRTRPQARAQSEPTTSRRQARIEPPSKPRETTRLQALASRAAGQRHDLPTEPAAGAGPPSAGAGLPARPADGASLVQIPAGPFVQGGDGASDEYPAHEVILSAYWIDRAPVTVGQYRRFLAAIATVGPPEVPLLQDLYPNGKDHTPQGWGSAEFTRLCPTDRHPVVLVDWFDACAYAAWAGARLPTEAEWERAARGGLGARTFPWGDAEASPRLAAFGRATTGPVEVGARPDGASAEGVLDLAGNVWEWCADAYDPRAYERLAERDPHLPVEGPRDLAVKRGGSWTNAAHSLRCAKRGFEKLHARRPNLGFRCAGPG